MAVPPPMPQIHVDPAVAAAAGLIQQYNAELVGIRTGFNPNEIEKARQIGAAWRRTIAGLAAFHKDLTDRRQARLDWLESQLLVGPDISDNESAADQAVLYMAWNTALEKVRAVTAAGRVKMLNDAERFGDVTTLRAVLTVASDLSETTTVDRYLAEHLPGFAAELREWRALRQVVGNTQSLDRQHQNIVFTPPRKPEEAHRLPAMVKAHNQTVQAHNASVSRRGTSYYGPGGPGPGAVAVAPVRNDFIELSPVELA